MNCFEHRDRAAIGVCCGCGRGLCEECVSDVQERLACKGKCEERVKLSSQIVDNHKSVMANTNKQIRVVSLFLFGLGIIFAILAIMSFRQDGLNRAWFPGGCAIFLLIVGVLRSRGKMKYTE